MRARRPKSSPTTRWKVSKDGRVMTVTPEMAEEWMRNSVYQALDAKHSKEILDALRNGEWRPGEERGPINIREGAVRNGYHRVDAIIRLGRPVEMLVKGE